MHQSSKTPFLGFTIKPSTSGDYDLSGSIEIVGDSWKSYLGNYPTIRSAKKASLVSFMLENPIMFHEIISRRLIFFEPTRGEWYKLAAVLETKGIKIPKELTMSKDSYILFDGKIF